MSGTPQRRQNTPSTASAATFTSVAATRSVTIITATHDMKMLAASDSQASWNPQKLPMARRTQALGEPRGNVRRPRGEDESHHLEQNPQPRRPRLRAARENRDVKIACASRSAKAN